MAGFLQTYEDWERCITVDCGIPLTPDFIAERIKRLEDKRDYQTRKFIEQWGDAHHAKTLGWFKQAQARVGA
ncbi:MAG: hypothetical protein AAGI14_12000 [Pseudomonadota bacterium]